MVCPKCSTRFREDYTRKITITRGSMMSGMQSPQKKVDVRRCISGHRNEGEEGGVEETTDDGVRRVDG